MGRMSPPKSALLPERLPARVRLTRMALTLAARGTPMRMLYAARSPEELVYVDRLRAALVERVQADTRLREFANRSN